MIRHVVLLKFKPETTVEQRQELMRMAGGLKDKIDFVRALEVGANVTESPRAFDMSLIVDLDDEQAIHEYAVHPNHQPVIKLSGELCEKVHVVDYVRPNE